MDRPDDPDFWALSEIVQDMDAVRDNNTMTLQEQVGQMIDLNSIIYMANGRTTLGMDHFGPLLRNLTKQQRDAVHAWLASTWLEAFYAGMKLQAKRGLPEISDILSDRELPS